MYVRGIVFEIQPKIGVNKTQYKQAYTYSMCVREMW